MVHQPYPAFSLECAQELWRLLRGRAIRDEFKLFCKCTYTLIGAGLGLSVGEPDDVEPLSFGAGEECDIETAEKLQGELQAMQDVGVEPGAFGAADDQAALDPATLALLIQLAMKAIEKWLERRRSRG